MAYTSEMQSAPVRFTIPQSLQRFDIFSKFPYDIRHMIWEEVIFTPGIHFLKLVETPDVPSIQAGANSGASPATLSEAQTEETRGAEGLVCSATLVPIVTNICADKSHYVSMSKTFAQLRDSCNEAKCLVDKVLARLGNLTLNNGQLVLLEQSSDIVCIDYPNMSHARHLGRWAEHLDLSQLAKVRRLAVRYHHDWDNDLVCGYCGRIHSYHGGHPYPRHVYEFAALFRNLEAFYFIDYLTVRKPPRTPRCSYRKQDFRGPWERFSSGERGRTYFEVDPESCTTHTRVYETLSWLRTNYIAHCLGKYKGPSHPENVRFKILTCEWDSDQKLAPVKRQGTQTTTRKKRTWKRTWNRTSDLITSSQNSSVPQPTNANSLPVVFGDGGKSKFIFSL
ncbi:hypothetical protein HD806DRAFT_78753 [Xylariaceae sp. AK1471]|nr:hypothetical protein HD806DRAFT_78753 [Xylariaceae sp. AK1471]